MILARRLTTTALLLALTTSAHAQSGEALAEPQSRIAVLHLEALGMEDEPVARLESLFRMELQRLTGHALPSRRAIARVVSSSKRLSKCDGQDKCLAAIGKRLQVDLVIVGNVAELGDSYIVDIKVIDVATGLLAKRMDGTPLRGSPDELIEAVRIAAYTLVAPDRLVGSITLLSDLKGAEVKLNGTVIGTTPSIRAIDRVPLGEHSLRVSAQGYHPFEEIVKVRFQKNTQVVVRLAATEPSLLAGAAAHKPGSHKPWHSSGWFYLSAGITAAALGTYLGYRLSRQPVVNCSESPSLCRAF